MQDFVQCISTLWYCYIYLSKWSEYFIHHCLIGFISYSIFDLQILQLQCILDAFLLVNRWILCGSSLETQILSQITPVKIRSSALTC